MDYESNMEFTWAAGWKQLPYDRSTFYRRQFQNCADSAAVDFVVLQDSGAMVWLLEIKDFTTDNPDADKGPLWEIVTRKVRDTLAGLAAAAFRAGDEERSFAHAALNAKGIRVAFHCERPKHTSRLFPDLPNPADLQAKLRMTLRSVDSKAIVVSTLEPRSDLPWTATWNPRGATK